MKISSSTDWLERMRADQPKSAPASAAGGFGDILKASLNPTSAAEATASGGTLSVQFRSNEPLSADSMSAKLEGLIDLLDEYRCRLADPRASLKALDPLVCSLERRCEALAPLLESLSEDTGLKDILSHALATSETEILRFRRGEYLSA